VDSKKINLELMNDGITMFKIDQIDEIKTLVENENYLELDQYFLREFNNTNGRLYSILNSLFPIDYIEHIIAVRSAPEDEEGIWHDDGSRYLGFSLSLNLNPQSIQGGDLRFRPKGQLDFKTITPRPFGTMILFLTGLYNYEHQVSQVTHGKRTVIAGWGYRNNS
jgi:hypothetical protein